MMISFHPKFFFADWQHEVECRGDNPWGIDWAKYTAHPDLNAPALLKIKVNRAKIKKARKEGKQIGTLKVHANIMFSPDIHAAIISLGRVITMGLVLITYQSKPELRDTGTFRPPVVGKYIRGRPWFPLERAPARDFFCFSYHLRIFKEQDFYRHLQRTSNCCLSIQMELLSSSRVRSLSMSKTLSKRGRLTL